MATLPTHRCRMEWMVRSQTGSGFVLRSDELYRALAQHIGVASLCEPAYARGSITATPAGSK